jgi:hypothetical protein
MLKFRLSIMLLSIAMLAAAQAVSSRLVPLHYISSDDVRNMLNRGAVTINAAPNNSVILIGNEAEVAAAEVIIKQVDVAPKVKDIDLIAYMITASPNEEAGKPIPAELESVARQLRSIFPYKSYRLLESAFMRVSNGGSATTDGLLPAHGSDTSHPTYLIMTGRVRVSSEGDDTFVHIQDFLLSLTLKGPSHIQQYLPQGQPPKPQTVRLQTTVDIKIGQKVVIGKSNINGSDDALIVVLAARIGD